MNRKFLGARGRAAVPRLDPRRGRREHAVRPVRRARSSRPAARTRRIPPRSYFKILRDAGGDDGEHDAPVPGHALQLQQVPRPSVRALDAGPVLPDSPRSSRRSTSTDDPASGDRRIGGTAVEGAKPLYEIVERQGRGRGQARAHRQGDAARRSRSPRKFEDEAGGDAPRAARRLDHLARTTRTSPRATSTASGAT